MIIFVCFNVHKLEHISNMPVILMNIFTKHYSVLLDSYKLVTLDLLLW